MSLREGRTRFSKLFLRRRVWANSRLKIRKLLGPNRENFLAFNFYFDAEGRAQVGALHNASAHPGTGAGQIGGFERVKHRAAAGISNHGMFRGAVAVIGVPLVPVRQAFELAIAAMNSFR